jgi:hypothetical protein
MDILTTLRRHLDWYLAHAVWGFSSPAPGLWWSMLDIETGGMATAARAAGVYRRCYRWIESPDGSNLYWDLPLVVACHAVSRQSGDVAYEQAAERYVRAYLARATSAGGLWWWGNHYYIGAAGQPVEFGGAAPVAPGARPVPARTAILGESEVTPIHDPADRAPLHETRPLAVPWRLLHRLVPEATLAALAAHRQHLVTGAGPGAFQRHADGGPGCAFPEAGGILALAFAHEAKLTGAAEATCLARQVLEYSWSFRDRRTNLMPMQPGATRWDGWQATSETGLWAGAAFAVAELLGQPDIAVMAAEAVGAWSAQAWSEDEQRHHGRLVIGTGEPNHRPKDTIYCPGTWCDPWEPLFPAHDYPLPAAEASLTAFQVTGEESHALAVARWVRQLQQSLPARNGWGAYAEAYGRAIHFLWRAGRVLARPAWGDLARAIADEALSVLDGGPALRSHPWEHRVDAVDGMGFLILALLCLEQDAEPEMHGMFW